jgi:hypothetical protein
LKKTSGDVILDQVHNDSSSFCVSVSIAEVYQKSVNERPVLYIHKHKNSERQGPDFREVHFLLDIIPLLLGIACRTHSVV